MIAFITTLYLSARMAPDAKMTITVQLGLCDSVTGRLFQRLALFQLSFFLFNSCQVWRAVAPQLKFMQQGLRCARQLLEMQ